MQAGIAHLHDRDHHEIPGSREERPGRTTEGQSTMDHASFTDESTAPTSPEATPDQEALFGGDLDSPKDDEARLFGGILSIAPELRGPLRHAALLRKVMREPVALMLPYWFEIK